MEQTLNKPIFGLDFDLPEEVYLLEDSIKKSFLIDPVGKSWGLICFTQEQNALNFFEHLEEGNPLNIKLVKFQEAREIAQQYPHLNSLIFFDDVENPYVHYVK